MTIIVFPREYRARVEVFTVRDRSSDDNRPIHIFEYVGHDEDGPFRIDMAHRHTLKEVCADVEMWWREGVEVVDAGLFA